MMTPGQAIQILDQYLSQISVNRGGHNQIMTALGVLNTLVEKDKLQKISNAKVKEDVAEKEVENK